MEEKSISIPELVSGPFKFDLLYLTFYDFSYFGNHILIYLRFKLEFHLHFPNNYPANWGHGESIEIQLTRVSGSVLSMTLGYINEFAVGREIE